MPMIDAAKTNPARKPPEGPRITAEPLLNPVKTGTPATPKKIYVITLITERFAPSTFAAVKTAKVCNETGTAVGMLNHEQMQMIAVKTPINAMSTVRLFLLISFKDTQP